jgi:hypothetical protein
MMINFIDKYRIQEPFYGVFIVKKRYFCFWRIASWTGSKNGSCPHIFESIDDAERWIKLDIYNDRKRFNRE